jgi:predicted TIM-barrel fold metal-dependent hydrolase
VGTFPAVIEVPHDTTRAVVSLLLSGSFARYRDIKWLFSHAGGTVPMLAGRMDYFFKFRKDSPDPAPQGYEAELKRLYYDTANATHPASMAALLKLVPGSQVVFGTDYPYVPINPQVEALETQGLPADLVQAIESGNARRLLPRLS